MDVNETRDERDGAIRLIDGIPNPDDSLVIMDRGYSGYNMVEHCNRYGGYYIIRNPLTNTIKEISELPDEPCDIATLSGLLTSIQRKISIYFRSFTLI